MPESVRFEEYESDGETQFWAKLQIDMKDYDAMCEKLNQVYPKPTVREEVFDANTDPFSYTRTDIDNLSKKIAWFDLSYEDVDLCYFKISSGEKNDGTYV